MGKQFVLLCPKSKGRSWTVNLNFFFFSSEVGITLPHEEEYVQACPHSPSCCPRELPDLYAVIAVKMHLFSSPRVPQSTWIHRNVSSDCTLLRQLRNEAEQSLWSAMETIAQQHFRDEEGTELLKQHWLHKD